MPSSSRRGFSLIELMVTMSTMTVLGSFGMVAIQAATSSANVAKAKADASTEVRALTTHMAAELQLAYKAHPDEKIQVFYNPNDTTPIELAFVIPGPDGVDRAIRYRYRSEDTNQNGLLDEDEDRIIQDGLLTRRVERVEIVDGSEITTILGGAHDVASLDFYLNGNLLKIVAVSSKAIVGTHYIDPATGHLDAQHIEVSSVARVYLMN